MPKYVLQTVQSGLREQLGQRFNVAEIRRIEFGERHETHGHSIAVADQRQRVNTKYA